MPKTTYVIKYDATTELYLQSQTDGVPTWSSLDNAVTFSSLAAAENVIALIGSGPIGVPK
jgi:hypothetical protein